MLWTCSSCGFYNDEIGDCCNCGKAQNFVLESTDIPDLLAIDQNNTDPAGMDLLDHTQFIDNEKNQKINRSQNQQNQQQQQQQQEMTSAFDDLADISTLVDTTNREEEEAMRKVVQEEAIIAEKAAKEKKLKEEEEKSKKGQEKLQKESKKEQEKLQEKSKQSTNTTPLSTNQQQNGDINLTISSDHYEQPTTLRYSIINYNLFRIFFFYISSNLILTFATVFTTTALIILGLSMLVDFDKGSFLDKFSTTYSPFIFLTIYIIYLALFSPVYPCMRTRSISLWDGNATLTSPNTFVDYIASHAPALTTAQINTINTHYSSQNNSFLVFVHIPPQFRTRSAVIGLHYIKQTGGLLNYHTDSSLQHNNHQYVDINDDTMFVTKWSNLPSTVKILRIIQLVSFLLLVEPVVTPIALSCIGGKKYGMKIVAKK